MASVAPVRKIFETILSLISLPALVILLLIGLSYGLRVVGLSRILNTRSGQLLLEVLVGSVILILSIAFAVSLLG